MSAWEELTGAKSKPDPWSGDAGIDAATAQRWMALGLAGITVSVCFGPCAGWLAWTVQAMGPAGDDFPRPFQARNLKHAIEIAEIEAAARWGFTPPEKANGQTS